MDSLEQKVYEGEVDEAILPIVEAINAHPWYFTTSSCAGRIIGQPLYMYLCTLLMHMVTL